MELATEDGPGQIDNFLSGGGEMGARMRGFDWSKTSLGPVDSWPQSLRTAVSICLSSRFPMVIWWGPDLILLYNDGWRPILGATKHPRALGSPGRDIWPEIWDVIGPMFDSVMTTGQATWSDDALLLVNRYGYTEETYFTWSYSPIRDESGGVAGVFTAVTETTERVIGERRMKTLRDLAARSLEARQVEEACRIAGETLATNPYDIPFLLLYLLDAHEARLTYAAGIDEGLHTSLLSVDVKSFPVTTPWPLAKVAESGHAELVECAGKLFEDLPEGPWHERPQRALVMPVIIPGQDLPSMLLVLAISPRRTFDDAYLNFFNLIASQIGSTLADALAYEHERQRAEALMELDRAKTAFFSNVSHEFRTPLTLMLGPLEEVLSGNLASKERKELEVVHRNGVRLLKLVNTLLDFSRIEAGRVRAVYEPTDLATYTAELASMFRTAIERVGIRLIVECSP
ncbi:MAG TPA: histidine kinase dimerization/phospho-acceptor domain-containing protein, partial [Blastocatellia bacterium]